MKGNGGKKNHVVSPHLQWDGVSVTVQNSLHNVSISS